MRNLKWVIILIVVGLLLYNKTKIMSYITTLKNFLVKYEGFSAKPYWDYKQWSWGYGTAAGFDKAKKPEGTITRERAWVEALQHINKDYDILKGKTNKVLSSNQWAALLSLSYNVGVGGAMKVLASINEGKDITKQWLSYNKVRNDKGQYAVHAGLTARRKHELELFNS